MVSVARSGTPAALGWVAMGSMVANVFAYLVHLTASRWWLGTAEYGELARALSATLLLGVAALAIQAVVARAVVAHAGMARIRAVTVATVGVVVLLAAVGTPLVAWIGSMPLTTAAAALATTPLLTVIGAAQGVLQGHQEFRLLAWVLAFVGVVRTLPVIGALALGAGPTGALSAGVIGTALGAVVGLLAVRVARSPRDAAADSVGAGPGLGEVLRAGGVQLVLIVASSIDLMLSGFVLSADDAGIYALGAIATKVAFWLPQAVGVVFYPRLADPAVSRTALIHAIRVVAAIGAVLTVAAGLAGPAVPHIIRADYQPLVGVLWLFALTGAMLAVLQVALLSAIARQATAVSLIVWAVVVVEAVLIFTVVHSVVALAVTAAVSAIVAAVMTIVADLTTRRAVA